MQCDLFVDFAGEIDVGRAALGTCLHDHSGDVRIDFGGFDPNRARIDSRRHGVVDRVVGNQRPVAGRVIPINLSPELAQGDTSYKADPSPLSLIRWICGWLAR